VDICLSVNLLTRHSEGGYVMEVPKLPDPGSYEWERMVDFMREDLESGMKHTEIELEARKLLASQGRDFDAEFKKWKEKKKNDHRKGI